MQFKALAPGPLAGKRVLVAKPLEEVAAWFGVAKSLGEAQVCPCHALASAAKNISNIEDPQRLFQSTRSNGRTCRTSGRDQGIMQR